MQLRSYLPEIFIIIHLLLGGRIKDLQPHNKTYMETTKRLKNKTTTALMSTEQLSFQSCVVR